MTENEINKAIDQLGECVDLPYGNDISGSTAETAIKALKEIQMYRDGKLSLVPTDAFKRQCEEIDAYKEIGTVEECREAVEKTKAKKVKTIGGRYKRCSCPTCGNVVGWDFSPLNCNRCGQRLESEE